MIKIHHRWGQRLALTAALVGAVAGLASSRPVQAQASALAIPDISEWQGRLTSGEVAAMKNQVAFVINRRQYGSAYQDLDATNNTDLYVKYGIPFGEYDYARFNDAASAKQEAKDFYDRSNKDANFYVLDFEEDDVTSGSTDAAVRAWYQEMRDLTSKHLVFYSYQSFATSYANAARQDFDAQWIANYSYEPTISFALWQYTDHGYLSALNQYTDDSHAETAVQPLSFWTDDSEALALTPQPDVASASSSSASAASSSTPAPSVTPQSDVTAASAALLANAYQVGHHVYLHSSARTYTDGTTIPVSARGKFYRISKVKKDRVYIHALRKWVATQDVTGYWTQNHRSYRLTHKLYVYTSASLTHRTHAYYVAGDRIRGKLVKAPNGRAMRIKTKIGYVSANTRYSTAD